MKPPNIVDAQERGLLVKQGGVHTFSNGDEWYSWADSNCDRCAYYDPEQAGVLCAFEAAAFLGMVTPDLARLFGWIEDAEYPGEFDPPQTCAFFRSKRDDNEDGPPRPKAPDPDPRQLVLIADPTEDIAGVRLPLVEVPVHV